MNLHLPAKLVFAANRSKLLLVKASPKLLMVGGLLTLGACVVTACRATIKAQDILEEAAENKAKCEKAEEMADADPTIIYTQADRKADRFEVGRRLVVGLAKVYWPSVVLGLAGVAMVAGGNSILTKRHVATMAALSATEKAFSEYRAKMKQALGADIERGILMGEKAKALPPMNKEELAEYLKEHPDERLTFNDGRIPPWCGPYARIWSRESAPRAYNGIKDMDRFWLATKESILNHKLRMRGHMFLNEVWDELCMERTTNGQAVGWIYKGDGTNTDGDDLIKLNIEAFWSDPGPVDIDTEVYLHEDFIIDPNCDGVIWDLIDRPDVRKWGGPINN